MNNERLISIVDRSGWKPSTRPFVDTWIAVGIQDLGITRLVDSGISQTPAIMQNNYYYLQGPSSRVNIGSTDQSINIISEPELFSKLREAVQAQIYDPSIKA